MSHSQLIIHGFSICQEPEHGVQWIKNPAANLAGAGLDWISKNSRISDLPEPELKLGASLADSTTTDRQMLQKLVK